MAPQPFVEFPEQLGESCKKLQLPGVPNLNKVLHKERTFPSSGNLYWLIQACIREKDLAAARRLCGSISAEGFRLDGFLCTHLIHMFSAVGSVLEATAVFESLEEPDVFAWSAIILANVKHGHHEKAFSYYKRMQQFNVQPNEHVLVATLKACTKLSHSTAGWLIHSHILSRSMESQTFVVNSLLDMYLKRGYMEDAFNLFYRLQKRDVVAWNSVIACLVRQTQCIKGFDIVDQMKSDGVQPDIVTWNTLLYGFAERGDMDGVLGIFVKMQKEEQKPDCFTFASAFKACAIKGALTEGKWLHEQLVESGIDYDLHVCNSIIGMYIKCKRMDDAYKQIQSLTVRDVITWTTLVKGYAEIGQVNNAVRTLQDMHREKKFPDEVTFATLVKACADAAAFEVGKLIHTYITECGFDCDKFVKIALVDLYANCSSFPCAFNLFGGSLEKDVVAWGALIGGLTVHGSYMSALESVHAMLHEGLEPNGIILLSLLSGCSQHGMVQEGESLLKSMTTSHGIVPKLEHYVVLIDLLGREGLLNRAKQVLQNVSFQFHIEGWICLLNCCWWYGDILLGRECFDRVRASGQQDSSIYVLMSRIYADANMMVEAEIIQEMLSKEIFGKKVELAFVEV